MIYKNPADQAVDDAAVKLFTDDYPERATSLPPVAIVIAAYNEEGAIGPVIQALPAEVIRRTAEKYAEALARLTGPPLAAGSS